MAGTSLPERNGGIPPNPPNGVWLSEEEWAEADHIDMAFYVAIRCEADDPHKLELVKSIQTRYSGFVYSVEKRLHPEAGE